MRLMSLGSASLRMAALSSPSSEPSPPRPPTCSRITATSRPEKTARSCSNPACCRNSSLSRIQPNTAAAALRIGVCTWGSMLAARISSSPDNASSRASMSKSPLPAPRAMSSILCASSNMSTAPRTSSPTALRTSGSTRKLYGHRISSHPSSLIERDAKYGHPRTRLPSATRSSMSHTSMPLRETALRR